MLRGLRYREIPTPNQQVAGWWRMAGGRSLYALSGAWRRSVLSGDDRAVTALAQRGTRAPRLLDEVPARLRVGHYSLRTERAYVGWIRRFILANGKRHPREMGEVEVTAFLTRLAVEGRVAAGTQNQALAALLFLYRHALGSSCRGWPRSCVRNGRDACQSC